MKLRTLAAAISTFGPISANAQADGITSHFKEKFEELTEESALILHDNLELRERLVRLIIFSTIV